MPLRPELNKALDSSTFRENYYLKEELVKFCRENGLPVSGSKTVLTERVAYFLETGRILPGTAEPAAKKSGIIFEISLESVIEPGFVCSEKHRKFFKEHIGSSFSFNVPFQQWLKVNSGKTYRDAVNAYYELRKNRKKGKSTINKQFEYNTYIRDFFAENPGKSLADAIRCWKYKKNLPGSHKYEKSDLLILEG